MKRFGLTLMAGVAFSAAISTDGSAATICPTIFQPVCGVVRGGNPTTYPNACVARNARARILHQGACLGPICFFIFNPVCALDPRTRRPTTYPNLCAAENARARLLYNGRCRGR